MRMITELAFAWGVFSEGKRYSTINFSGFVAGVDCEGT
jgi:hypothetical protein